MREATAVAVLFYTILVMMLLWKHSQGEVAYLDFLESVQSPWMVLIHFFGLLLLLLHSITWFILTPKAEP